MFEERPLKEGDLLTLDEAARVCRTTVATIKSWLHQDKLVRTKIAGKTLIHRQDLEAFVKSSTTLASSRRREIAPRSAVAA